MTYNLLHPIRIFLFLNYSISIVLSFHGHWWTGSIRSAKLNVLTKFNDRVYDLHFDPQKQYGFFCRNLIPYNERQIKEVDNIHYVQSKLMSYIGSHSRATFQLHMNKLNNDDTSFDFSSKIGWEEYYKRGLTFDDDNNDGSISAPSITTEWHTSIPLETISSYCWRNIGKNCNGKEKSIDNADSINKSFLMIGCGTSRLVDVIMAGNPYNETKNDDIQFTLLDSSQTCIDELTRRYSNFENIHCVCGDAIELTKTLSYPRQNTKFAIPQRYDTIIDKGLMDVLFCSDDWTSSVETLFTEATKVLVSGGTYILISYKIPNGTKDFLSEIANGLDYAWDFDCIGSTERVTISLADQKNRC